VGLVHEQVVLQDSRDRWHRSWLSSCGRARDLDSFVLRLVRKLLQLLWLLFQRLLRMRQ
jgi:hypothetical protein